MSTVFSHIVQKRLSQENENVATEALAFILRTSDAARLGLVKLLRGIAPDLPSLRFLTQQTEETARPDMWGLDGATPRVFIESKFWAGLTNNQPVTYLRLLAKNPQPTILLVVVPTARQGTIWRELIRRTDAENLLTSDCGPAAAVYQAATTNIGPILALVSWAKLLSAIEAEMTEEPERRNDLLQLRALCDATDRDAFVPISSSELTDQRTPAFVLQLVSVIQSVVDLGVSEGILNIKGLNPQSSWERIGRYISFPIGSGTGAWFGAEFRLWKDYGSTPLWLFFPSTDWGRGLEVRDILESWAHRHNVASALRNDGFVVGIDLPTGEEMDSVVRSVVNRLRDIAMQLSILPDKQVQPDGTGQ